MESVFAGDRQLGSLRNKSDEPARPKKLDLRRPALTRTDEDHPDVYDSNYLSLPWYSRVPASFLAAQEAVALAEGLKTDYQTRGLQIKERLGEGASIDQFVVAFR